LQQQKHHQSTSLSQYNTSSLFEYLPIKQDSKLVLVAVNLALEKSICEDSEQCVCRSILKPGDLAKAIVHHHHATSLDCL